MVEKKTRFFLESNEMSNKNGDLRLNLFDIFWHLSVNGSNFVKESD